MSRKGDIPILHTIIGAVIGVIIVFFFFYSVFPHIFLIFASEKGPDATTVSSLNNLADSIEKNERASPLVIQGKYYMVFFNKRVDKGLGNFYRPDACFDKNLACICLCYTSRGKIENYCSDKDNKEITKCRNVDIDEFILEGFDREFIDMGGYKIDVVKDKKVVKIINNK